MKRIIIIGSLVSCALLALTGEVQAQSGIEQGFEEYRSQQ